MVYNNSFWSVSTPLTGFYFSRKIPFISISPYNELVIQHAVTLWPVSTGEIWDAVHLLNSVVPRKFVSNI